MQNVVGRIKDSAEQVQLLAQYLESKPMRLIVPSDEIDDCDIALLAVPMAAPDALFDALRVPRQVVIDNGLAKL
jgi:predicted dinucleotide-binding enzyme